uniref:NTF2-related export protein n=1 Tax=Ditylenchus dipsaci TaxID=166011 RepID=A0A915DNV7_9BILA
MSSLAAKRSEDEEICQDASKFMALYNDLADIRRSRIGLIYDADDATLLWNGNVIRGTQEITGFWNALPTTQHELSYMDAHLMDPSSASKNLVVQVMGTVSLGGISRAYNQVLILVSLAGNYKIKSDCMRLLNKIVVL